MRAWATWFAASLQSSVSVVTLSLLAAAGAMVAVVVLCM
jgi:hypothetical protein